MASVQAHLIETQASGSCKVKLGTIEDSHFILGTNSICIAILIVFGLIQWLVMTSDYSFMSFLQLISSSFQKVQIGILVLIVFGHALFQGLSIFIYHRFNEGGSDPLIDSEEVVSYPLLRSSLPLTCPVVIALPDGTWTLSEKSYADGSCKSSFQELDPLLCNTIP
jgi:hypothetical protein